MLHLTYIRKIQNTQLPIFHYHHNNKKIKQLLYNFEKESVKEVVTFNYIINNHIKNINIIAYFAKMINHKNKLIVYTIVTNQQLQPSHKKKN